MIYNDRYVLKCPQGYLSDVDKYVDDPRQAIAFTKFDQASRSFAILEKDFLKSCQIVPIPMGFPKYKDEQQS